MSEDYYWELAEENPDAIVWEEYEQAFLGIGYKHNMKPVAVYDKRVLHGLIIEELLLDDAFIDSLTKEHDDNEEAITQAVVKEAIKTFNEKVFPDEEGDFDNRPIFLDIPYLDSRYEMMEEE